MNRARKILHADYVHRLGYTGKNVTVVIMDTGISDHPDFSGRILDFQDFTHKKKAKYDDNGHGTHVAGIIGGSGFISHGVYTGIAPGANLIMLKVLDKSGNGNIPQAKEAIHWILEHQRKYNIRIVNISVGMSTNVKEGEKHSFLQMVEDLWDRDMVVVTAAGNKGPLENSITIPGLLPSVITVGSSDDMDPSLLTKYTVKGYSGCGPTEECVVKPEVIAPGTGIYSCATNGMYGQKSGTSMATPMVSGAIALLLEKYPLMNPAQIKMRLFQTSIPLEYDKKKQGWGLLNIERFLGC